MLEDFFVSEKTIFLKEKVDWKKGIQTGVDLLVKHGSAKQELYDQIISSTEEYGPYYIIVPKIALAHSSPGPWSLKPDLSFVFLKDEVKFSDKPENAVKLIICLSAPDDDGHRMLLQKFVSIFSDSVLCEKILKSNSFEELYK